MARGDMVFEQDDLYAMNRLINKLNDAGYSHDAAKLIAVREFHFNEEGEPCTENWL
jgi:hypothetical protein